jgi:hypothetical protein
MNLQEIFRTAWTVTVMLATAAIPLVLIWRRKVPADGFLRLCALAALLLAGAIWLANNHTDLDLLPGWQNALATWLTYDLAPTLAVLCAARLLSLPASPLRTLLNCLIAALLAGLVGVQMFFTSLWDVSTDGLGGPFLTMIVYLAVLLSVLAMLVRAAGARKALALVILIGFPLLLSSSVRLAGYGLEQDWGRMPGILTERGAESIQDAILRYHDRQGSYPARLSDLTPRELLILPRQYILPGRQWCYAGGAKGYRLGYIYREFFSAPQSLKIVAETGTPPTQAWNCPLEEVRNDLVP